DLNGDGRLDLVAPCPNQNLIALLLGTPGGGFSPSVTYFTGEQPRAAVLARFGNDLHADLATVNSGSDDLSLREGDGAGTFGGPVSYATGSNAVAIAVLDFDGDGRMDLSVANLLGHTVALYRNITAEPPFLRGDVNNDGMINLADPVSILSALFLGSTAFTCTDAADTDDSGQLGIGDAILSLTALFDPGSPLATTCEVDDTEDALPSCAYATTVCP
ncbi:MAG: FG-GAP-like repeat-containing protein, partial [Planctomycetota bacterium]